MGRGDLSDEQWSVLESLLPAAGVSRRWPGRRRLVDGVRWRVRTCTSRREHDVIVETSIDQIAGDLTKWLTTRAT